MTFEFSSKANAFLNKILSKTLDEGSPTHERVVSLTNKNEAIIYSPKYDSDLPSFQEMIYQKESSEFFQVFLSNKLSK